MSAAAATTGGAAERVLLVAGGGRDTNTSIALPPATAQLSAPFGVDFDAVGNLYFVEMLGNRVRRLDTNGLLTVFAGTGVRGSAGDGGPARLAQFDGIHSLAISVRGEIFLADTWNSRVRKIDLRDGRVVNFAGTGEKGYDGDGGPAVRARFGNVYCTSLDPLEEDLLLADLDNLRIRAVNLRTGLVRTVAGNGAKGVPPEGARATAAPLVDPRAVIADREGRVYILERGGHALRVVERDGRIHTVVGASGRSGNSGDEGPAVEATLNGPKHLCLDLDGGVLIADTENHVIRKYTPKDGRIVRVAGTGRRGNRGIGGPPLGLELNQPHGVHVHSNGDLYLSDSSNQRVLKLERVRPTAKP